MMVGAVLSDESLMSPNRLLDRCEAAGHLGVTPMTVSNWTHSGLLPFVDLKAPDKTLPVKFARRRNIRFRMADLDALILSKRNQYPRWDAMSPTLPPQVACRLLGVKLDGLRQRLSRGILDDQTPEAIRRSIERKYHQKFYKILVAEYMTRMRRRKVCPVCKRYKDEKRRATA